MSRKPSPTTGRGEIRADALYPIGVFLRRLGIGRHSLTALAGKGYPSGQSASAFSLTGGEALDTLRRLWQQQGDDRQAAGDGGSGDE